MSFPPLPILVNYPLHTVLLRVILLPFRRRRPLVTSSAIRRQTPRREKVKRGGEGKRLQGPSRFSRCCIIREQAMVHGGGRRERGWHWQGLRREKSPFVVPSSLSSQDAWTCADPVRTVLVLCTNARGGKGLQRQSGRTEQTQMDVRGGRGILGGPKPNVESLREEEAEKRDATQVPVHHARRNGSFGPFLKLPSPPPSVRPCGRLRTKHCQGFDILRGTET